MSIHGIEGLRRPPTRSEIPSLRMLSYGTSITQGSSAVQRHLCFVASTARKLFADGLNLGSAASALCEPELADYIAQREDWQIATLALSTNMSGFSLPDFEARVAYMVNTIGSTCAHRLTACITLWPKTADLGNEHLSKNCGGPPEAYREVLRKVVRECPHPNVCLLEGPELLPDLRDLTLDLLHPSDHGHVTIAENLAQALLAKWSVFQERM